MNNTTGNQYDYLSSKIKRIFLPLPNFKYFHKPSEVNEVDPRFIGRERIIKTLTAWLNGENGQSGSYLITGYRGMGKSSFVGKVIDELIQKQKRKEDDNKKIKRNINIHLSTLLLLSLLFIYLLLGSPNFIGITSFYSFILACLIILEMIKRYSIDSQHKEIKTHQKHIKWHIWLSALFIIICILSNLLNIVPDYQYYYLTYGITLDFITGLILIFFWTYQSCKQGSFIKEFKHNFSIPFIKEIPFRKYHKYIHVIKINLGNEVSGEREILALIANSIKTRFNFYIRERYPHSTFLILFRSIIIVLISLFTLIIYNYSMFLINDPGIAFIHYLPSKGILRSSIEFLNLLLLEIRSNGTLNMLLGGTSSFIISFLIYRYILQPLTLTLFKYVGRPLTIPASILRKLDKLCERIDSTIDEDNDPYGSIGTSSFNLSLKRKKTKKYQQATIREIEQELIEIINEIQNSHILNSRFIIVLDELDKIELKSPSINQGNLSPSMPEFSFDENGLTDYKSSNEKKRKVLHLLGQLKYFINTAKAKFVFIAGHELYDAYLADVSDREFSVSSIFNGVINVDSFFTCDSRTKDIMKMTETYICKQLTRTEDEKNEKNGKRDIDKYNLEEYVKHLSLSNDNNRERDKIISFLRQFITYLTFVSNGAPKKLTTTFEKYVISKEEFEKHESEKGLIISTNTSEEKPSHYLAFGYYDQQKIGFIHYIAYPIFDNIISPSSEYGDKLLVSSSFLIAHIYKHHNSGFSWRNLEYLPELIDNNRTPELREYINSIIGYLGKMHLTPITSGIYNYKFPMKLVEEISSFTKKSEEISAIFNFSLDYSSAVRKYYLKLLEYHQKEQNNSPIALANLHHYLGDIHMANDEYTEAIVQFRLAADILDKHITNLSQENNDKLSTLVVRYTRAMLKLGLAYEKRNTIDSAYMVYNDLTLKLIEHRNINEKKLRLCYKVDRNRENTDNYWQEKHIILYKKIKEMESADDFERESYPKEITPKEEEQIKYWIYGEELTDNMCDFLTPAKSALISKLSIFEDLRLAYLPILAKLFSIEKQNICGITKDNIKIAESEFKYMFLITNSLDKYLLNVDFFRKIGDILYYKNKHFYRCKNSIEDLFASWGYDIKDVIFSYCYNLGMTKEQTSNILNFFCKSSLSMPTVGISTFEQFTTHIEASCKDSNIKTHIRTILENTPNTIQIRISSVINCAHRRSTEKSNNIPCFSCRYYNRSLTILKANLIDHESTPSDMPKAIKFLRAIRNKELKSYRHSELTQAALTLDAMGNVQLSCSQKEDSITEDLIMFILTNDESQLRYYSFSRIEKAILYYMAAMEYHYKAANNKEGTQCIVKIFNIISAYIRTHPNSLPSFRNIIGFDIELQRRFVCTAIEETYSNRDYDNIVKINEFRRNIQTTENIKPKFNLGLTSIMPDIEEVLLAYYEIKLKLNLIQPDEFFDLYNSPSLTYLRCDSLTYNRVISLLFKVNLNECMMNILLQNDYICKDHAISINKSLYEQYLLSKDGIDPDKIEKVQSYLSKSKVSDHKELVEFFISDSILAQKNLNPCFVLGFNNLCNFYTLMGYDLPTCWFLRFA